MSCSLRLLTSWVQFRAVARFLCLGAVPDPKKFFELRSSKEIFWSSGGSGGMLPQKNFKIKGPRLPKNAFPKVSAWKNWIKIS